MASSVPVNGDSAEQSAFVERLGGAMAASGAPPMAARVMARMLISESGAMTSAELADALEVSQPSISGAIRFLAQIGFVSRERVPRTRKERYRISDNVWETVLTLRNDSLDTWKAALQSGIGLYGEDSETGRRLTEAVEFFEFVQEDMRGLIRRWHERRG
ncbi:GbsR/MarR family transcriptional regulator [Nocardia mexicana]|uniref:MarR family protein n=1 Tax=Nocardia mexicana TaxID=279262 RepID=A0A370H1P9_9NOCA|nr:MarR family transcriptional regulator [Nocardia mexicana]RDI49594.1 MarR family protein [Nocardia mexicana]